MFPKVKQVVVVFCVLIAACAAHGAPVELIGPQTLWKARDDGGDSGHLWRAPIYNDNGWRSGVGQFGYGEGDEATRLGPFSIHYFRCPFVVERPADFESLAFQVLRDDGVVVYLNGNELFRMNMPEGPIDYQTPASTTVASPDENTFFPTNVSAAWLVQGTNMLAVELHQVANSNDGSFDLRLYGIEAVSRPTLVFNRPAGQARLEWDSATYRLEQAVLPTGAWAWVTNAASPFDIPAGNSRLFRLRSR